MIFIYRNQSKEKLILYINKYLESNSFNSELSDDSSLYFIFEYKLAS